MKTVVQAVQLKANRLPSTWGMTLMVNTFINLSQMPTGILKDINTGYRAGDKYMNNGKFYVAQV